MKCSRVPFLILLLYIVMVLLALSECNLSKKYCGIYVPFSGNITNFYTIEEICSKKEHICVRVGKNKCFGMKEKIKFFNCSYNKIEVMNDNLVKCNATVDNFYGYYLNEEVNFYKEINTNICFTNVNVNKIKNKARNIKILLIFFGILTFLCICCFLLFKNNGLRGQKRGETQESIIKEVEFTNIAVI